MGRQLQGAYQAFPTALSVAGSLPTKVAPPGYLGDFGLGRWLTYTVPGSYTFTVPSGVSNIRVRVVGGGGGGSNNSTTLGCGGGGGGGYAHGVFNVTPGTNYTVTVGNRGPRFVAGGTTSFGALISATGGHPGAINGGSTQYLGGAGGTGTGGDFQANGGNGGNGGTSGSGGNVHHGGGGGAGSQLGNGGNGGNGGAGSGFLLYAGGGGVGGGNGSSETDTGNGQGAGGSAFGPAIDYTLPGPDCAGGFAVNPINATIRFPFDGFTGCGGRYTVAPGPGGGGSAGYRPVAGGGGTNENTAGNNFGGGGSSGTNSAGCGLVIVEW